MKRLAFIVLLLSLLLTACGALGPATPTVTPQPDGPTQPTKMPTPTLSGPLTPTLNIKINVSGGNPHDMGGIPIALILTPNVDAPNVNMSMTLPKGMDVLTGAPTWAGDLKANQSIMLSLLLTIDQLSSPDAIKVEAASYPKDAPKISASYTLYMRPTSDGKIEFSPVPFK
jgi:hypothetical protein